MLLIQRSSDTPIRPRDIDVDGAFPNVFGDRESEIAAYWIVHYCQSRKSWVPFDFDKLVSFCIAHDPRFEKIADYLSNGISRLVVEGLVTVDKKTVTISTMFVARCYGSAPVACLPRKRRPRPRKSPAKSALDRLLDDADLV